MNTKGGTGTRRIRSVAKENCFHGSESLFHLVNSMGKTVTKVEPRGSRWKVGQMVSSNKARPLSKLQISVELREQIFQLDFFLLP